MSTSTLPQRFAGRAVLITGAASGIGRAAALRLAAEGASVMACDVNAEGLEATAKEAGSGVRTRVTNVRDPAECRAAVADTVEAFGRLDVLGNIAGIMRFRHLAEVTEYEYRTMFAVNTDAYFFLSQAAVPHLLETRGNIVNIASNAALMGVAYASVYCMNKGAVVQLTRALAMEFIKRDIRINAIAPGGTETGIAAGMEYPREADPALLSRVQTPRPIAKPEHIANLFAFVASDEAVNVHGAILSSDSGLTAG